MISGSSYGLRGILNTLIKLTASPNKYAWSLYLINAFTLVRNVYTKKNMTVGELMTEFNVDCINLLSAIDAYAATYKRPSKPIICMYFPEYDSIPSLFCRPRDKFPIEYGMYHTVKTIMLRSLIEDNPNNVLNNTLFITSEVPLPYEEHWPHVEVFRDLSKRFPGVSAANAVMISHAPIDYHLRSRLQRFMVLESFTGTLKTFNELKSKVIPIKDEEVPFNKYTHLLYGDSICIKSQLTRKTRAELVALAKEEHWSILPNITIAESLISHNLATKELILDPDV